MKRPLSNAARQRIIRELIEQAQADTHEWDALDDEQLAAALNDHRARKLEALARASEKVSAV